MTADYGKLVQEYRQKNKRAFVLGFTGTCGKELVKALLRSNIFAEVVLIGRRIVTFEDELYKNVEQRYVDFSNISAYAHKFENFDVGYCCLGTTYEQGPAGYPIIDKEYVLNAAQLAKKGGCLQFHVITALGSDKNSYLTYFRIKGETQEELKAMDFESLIIYQPALVMVEREQRKNMEALLNIVLKPIEWFFPTLMTVPVSIVARAMLNKTLMPVIDKVEIIGNSDMHVVATN